MEQPKSRFIFLYFLYELRPQCGLGWVHGSDPTVVNSDGTVGKLDGITLYSKYPF